MRQQAQVSHATTKYSAPMRWAGLVALSMYICVLGLLFVHSLGDEHHIQEVQQCCRVNTELQELHYHGASERCALPTHALLPATLSHILRLDKPSVIELIALYHELRAEAVQRTVCFYQLRAPPSTLA